MKRVYLTPESELIDINMSQILSGSGGEAERGTEGGAPGAGGGSSMPGGGTSAPEFFGDGIPEED